MKHGPLYESIIMMTQKVPGYFLESGRGKQRLVPSGDYCPQQQQGRPKKRTQARRRATTVSDMESHLCSHKSFQNKEKYTILYVITTISYNFKLKDDD